jgi:hypothetical protein
MDPSQAPRFEPMTTGTLLDRSFRLYATNFALLLGVTATAYVPFHLILLSFQSTFGVNVRAQGGDASVSALHFLFFFLLVILWSSIAFPIAAGAATFAISERYLGNDVTIGTALRRGLSSFWTLSWAEITATLRMFIGLLLLIVPGILWMLSYALIVPVVLIEGQKAIPSLRRSRDLMKGHRGKAFCVLLVLFLFQAILGAGVGMIAGLFFNAQSPGGAIVISALDNLLSVLTTPLYSIATILLYYDMRIRKEGFDLEMLSRAIAAPPLALSAEPTLSR